MIVYDRFEKKQIGADFVLVVKIYITVANAIIERGLLNSINRLSALDLYAFHWPEPGFQSHVSLTFCMFCILKRRVVARFLIFEQLLKNTL